jgi:hypothetical protein
VDDATSVGNMVIMLNKDYKEGEVAIGYDSKDTYFEPAEAGTNQFIIAA